MKTQIVFREFFHEIFFQPHKTIWIEFISAFQIMQLWDQSW